MERLSGLDASFLYLENGAQHMHVCMTTVIDPSTMPEPYSFEGIKDFINSRLHLVPPFRRRVVNVPFQLYHPVWIEDPDFDIDYHIRRVAAPRPGGPRELAALAGDIASRPLNRDRPLWEIWVVEDLEDGHIGVVSKMHHCAIDGVSGTELMVHLLDLEPDPTPVEPPAAIEPDRIPSDLELAAYAMASRWRRRARFVPLAARTVSRTAKVVQRRRDPAAARGAIPLTAPQTIINGKITPHRSVSFARIPLGGIKEIKSAFGVTVNDVVLAVCSGTLRRYLLDRDALPATSLIASCPVSIRSDDEKGQQNNRVSSMFPSLATDVDDPVERLMAISRSTRGAKDEHNAIGGEMFGEWNEYAAPRLFALASRLIGALGTRLLPVNLVISNVPGPPFPLYYNGAKMVAAYPMGPLLDGQGLNITVLSYMDNVDIGFMCCRELVPDEWALADLVEPAFQELHKAAHG